MDAISAKLTKITTQKLGALNPTAPQQSKFKATLNNKLNSQLIDNLKSKLTQNNQPQHSAIEATDLKIGNNNPEIRAEKFSLESNGMNMLRDFNQNFNKSRDIIDAITNSGQKIDMKQMFSLMATMGDMQFNQQIFTGLVTKSTQGIQQITNAQV